MNYLTINKTNHYQDPELVLNQIGTYYGGKVIPEIKSGAICYSFGIGEDISFDIGLVEKYDAQVFCFDPTPLAVKHFNENNPHGDKMKFFPIGVSYREKKIKMFFEDPKEEARHMLGNNNKFKCLSVPKIMKMLDHTHIDLIKIDIEGEEYGVLWSMMINGIFPKIICVEFHYFSGKLLGKIYKHITILGLYIFGYRIACKKGFDYTFVIE